MKKPVINADTCLGCGTCAACAGNTFAVNGTTATVINPTGDSDDMIASAVASCPTTSITLVEE